MRIVPGLLVAALLLPSAYPHFGIRLLVDAPRVILPGK